MIASYGWAALALLAGYLVLFFWGSSLAAQAAGRSVWLLSRAKGRDRFAAIGFRRHLRWRSSGRSSGSQCPHCTRSIRFGLKGKLSFSA